MLNTLTSSLDGLNVSRKTQKDVTSIFFETTEKIPFGTIVKSNSFPLLHGTHALEILNPRLDSYLVAPVLYQNKTLDESNALGITTGLLRALACWLSDNVSLSNSLLAYEPLCTLLEKYEKHGDLRFLGTEGNWNDIVDRLIVAVIGCVKFVLKCGLAGVVYEDEDITTRTMDLDWLYTIETSEILNLISIIPQWTDNKQILGILDILKCWISFESILSLKLVPFKSAIEVKNKQDQICGIINILNNIETIDIGELPPNCFNTNALRKYNNFSPPKTVSQLSWAETIVNLKELFQDTNDVLELNAMQSIIELREWLTYLKTKRYAHNEDEILGLHVVPRMILQLFFIRDDESIFGDENFKIDSLLWDWMRQATLLNSSLDMHQDDTFESEVHMFVENLKLPFSQELTSVSQNPSRQRQILCKSVLFWDKFQAELPEYEASLNKRIQDVSNETQQPIMPLLSFIYFEKLEKMVEITLKSIELDLFKDVRELTSGYFVLIYQIDHFLSHLERLKGIYHYRVEQLSSYPKKIKKLAGEKKAKVKKEYELKKSQVKDIETTLSYWDFKYQYHKILKLISELKLTLLQVLCSMGFDELSVHAQKRVSAKQLYQLQWKPFNSIGVPALPTYEELSGSVKSFNETFELIVKENKINRISILVQDHMKQVSALVGECESILTKFISNEPLLNHFKCQLQSLKRVAVTSQLELSASLKTIDINNLDKTSYTVIKSSSTYFPSLKLCVKK